MRQQGLAGEFISVYLHEGQRAVNIATDGGRVCRPLIIVDYETGRPKLKQQHLEALAAEVITIRDLLSQGVVEYVDCNEENNTLIALTERELEIAIQQGLTNRKMRYTHLEVEPFSILGVIGGIIPVSRNAVAVLCVGHKVSVLYLAWHSAHLFFTFLYSVSASQSSA